MDNLFQSFDARVSTDSFDTLSGCVISWLEEYCSPQVGGAGQSGRGGCWACGCGTGHRYSILRNRDWNHLVLCTL